MREQTLVLPYLAPNLNDLLRTAKEAAAARGVVRFKRKVLRKSKVKRVHVNDAYAALKAQWATRVMAHVREQRIEPFPNGAHLTYTIVEPTRRRDPGNFCAGTDKFVCDGLVKCGVLPNDGWCGVLSLAFGWEQGERPCVRVTLREEPWSPDFWMGCVVGAVSFAVALFAIPDGFSDELKRDLDEAYAREEKRQAARRRK